MARTPKLRHQRHSRYSRLRRNKSLIAWLTQVASALSGTGTAKTFTADVVHALGTLTFGGNASQDDTVTIGFPGSEVVYTFRSVIESEKAVGTLTAVANCNAGDTVSIDGHVYTWVTQVEADASSGTLTNVANFNVGDQVSIGTVGNEVVYEFVAQIEADASTGVITALSEPNDGDTVTVGAKTYRFKDALAQVNDVKRSGVSASQDLDNLIAAINLSGTEGVEYFAGQEINADVSAAAGAGDTVDLTAKVAGVAGDSIPLSESTSGVRMTVTAFSGGKDEEAAYSVEVAGNASDTLDNLIAAITAGVGEGTVYGTGTVAHTEVTAAAGAGDTVTVTALVAGVAGDAITTTVPVGGARGDFAAGTLGGGKDEEAADSVEKAGNASDSLDNLIAAINGAAGEGTTYGTGTVAHATVDAVAGAGDTVTVSAKTAGTAGNSIATTVPVGSARMDFADATLLGGEAVEPAYTVEIGASASDTLDNLIAAINGAAGEGTVYGTGTVAHTDVTAAAGAGDTMVVTAIVGGSGGNDIATDTDVAASSFGDTSLQTGADSNEVTSNNHGFNVGEGPFLLTTNGSLPGGLYTGVLYYVKTKADANSLSFCSERGGRDEITLTSKGSGTHTMTRAASAEAVFGLLKLVPREVIDAATDVDDLNG